MNMNRCAARSCKHQDVDPRLRFYRSLRKFVRTLLILFALGIFLDGGFFEIFGLVALFWGLSLSMKAIRLNGIPGTKGWLSDDWFAWINRRYDAEPVNIPGNKKSGYTLRT